MKLSNEDSYKIDDGLYKSLIDNISLVEFSIVKLLYCEANHRNTCTECKALAECAIDISECGVTSLRKVFCKHFPKSKYISNKAVRRLMNLPVIIFDTKTKLVGADRLFVTENKSNMDCKSFVRWYSEVIKSENVMGSLLSKEKLKAICDLASSEKDRMLLKHAVCEAQGLSAKEASRKYGVYNLHKLKEHVNQALDQAQEIRSAVNTLAEIEEKATLEALGIFVDDENSEEEEDEGPDEIPTEIIWDSDSDESEDNEEGQMGINHPNNQQKNNTTTNQAKQAERVNKTRDVNREILDPDTLLKNATEIVNPVPSLDHLVLILRENNLNWFMFVHELQTLLANFSPMVLHQTLLDFSYKFSETDLSEEEEQIVEQSRQAFLALQRERESVGNEENQEIVTDSESDNPDDWVGITDVLSNDGKQQVLKQRRIFKRKARREAAKEIAKRHILERKLPQKVCKTVIKYPNIGKDIEKFVEENRVGADQWRRTGVYTFDGNTKKQPRLCSWRLKPPPRGVLVLLKHNIFSKKTQLNMQQI